MKDHELLNAISDMMDDKLEPLKTDISDLKTSVSNLESDVAGLKTDVAGLKTDVSGLKTDVESLKTSVSNLESDVSEMKTDISELKTRVTKLEVDNETIIIPGINELRSAYNSEFDKYQISIKDHERLVTDVDALKTVVPHHSEQIAELQQVCGL